MDILDPGYFVDDKLSYWDGEKFAHYEWGLIDTFDWDPLKNPFQPADIIRLTIETLAQSYATSWIYTLLLSDNLYSGNGEGFIEIPYGTQAGIYVYDIPVPAGHFERLVLNTVYVNAYITGLELIVLPPPVFWTNFKGQKETLV